MLLLLPVHATEESDNLPLIPQPTFRVFRQFFFSSSRLISTIMTFDSNPIPPYVLMGPGVGARLFGYVPISQTPFYLFYPPMHGRRRTRKPKNPFLSVLPSASYLTGLPIKHSLLYRACPKTERRMGPLTTRNLNPP